jgi:hypothetical protein
MDEYELKRLARKVQEDLDSAQWFREHGNEYMAGYCIAEAKARLRAIEAINRR